MSIMNVAAPKPPPETTAWFKLAHAAIQEVKADSPPLTEPVPNTQLAPLTEQAAARYKSLAQSKYVLPGNKAASQQELLVQALNGWSDRANFPQIFDANGHLANTAVSSTVRGYGQGYERGQEACRYSRC